MKTLLIDAMNIFIRAYVVNPSMSENGNHIGGTLGFLKSIGAIARRFSPDDMIVVWEGGGSPRRRALLPAYKGNRRPLRLNRADIYEDIPDTKENFNHQISLCTKLLTNTPIRQIYVADCEADDVIGYLAKHVLDEDVIIASSDKDFYQLINENVIQWTPTTKKIVDIATVLSEFKIHPNNFATAKCFVGDSSDNIDGIRGCGFKTLVKRFPKLTDPDFVSVEDIINDCRNQPQKQRLNIHNNILIDSEKIKRNWRLMYLDTANLSAYHIDRINSFYQYKDSKRDKLGMMRNLISEGVTLPRSLDVDKFYLDLSTIK